MKTAIIVISNPQGGEESLARLFNALALAAECQAADDTFEIGFTGTGTRWPAVLSQLSHPAHASYQALRENVVGASCACAAAFGDTAGLEACAVPLKTENRAGSESGMLSIRHYLADGWNVLIF
jgi:hypothetical protein